MSPHALVGTLFDRVVPPAQQQVKGWHVSPVVDLLAYHYSWALILVPLLLAGDKHYGDYLLLWAVGITLSFVHRHFTMPYVYLDKQVFQQHPTRFVLFMGLLMLGFVATAFLFRFQSPPSFFGAGDAALALAGTSFAVQLVVAERRGPVRLSSQLAAAAAYVVAVGVCVAGVYTDARWHLLAAAALCALFLAASLATFFDTRAAPVAVAAVGLALVVAVANAASGEGLFVVESRVKGAVFGGFVGAIAAFWNVWHTLMQKFGIVRMYAAKSDAPVDRRTPAWVDRLVIFSWFPLLAAALGPAQRELIAQQSKSVSAYLMPIIDVLDVIQPVLLPIGVVLVVVALVLFVRAERNSGVWCWPRLSMVASLTLLNASFFVTSPLKVYIAYGFSHAVEYMVFVWAFVRRRYATPSAPVPLLQRMLATRARTLAFWGTFALAIGAAFLYVEFGDDFGWHPPAKDGWWRFLDVKVGTWLFAFAIWHSFAHFYYDGFLWKMRNTQVRASL